MRLRLAVSVLSCAATAVVSSRLPSPLLAQEPLAFQSISAGHSHTCALTPAGEAFCWGRNDFGQLGNGAAAERCTYYQGDTFSFPCSSAPLRVEGGLRAPRYPCPSPAV